MRCLKKSYLQPSPRNGELACPKGEDAHSCRSNKKRPPALSLAGKKKRGANQSRTGSLGRTLTSGELGGPPLGWERGKETPHVESVSGNPCRRPLENGEPVVLRPRPPFWSAVQKGRRAGSVKPERGRTLRR